MSQQSTSPVVKSPAPAAVPVPASEAETRTDIAVVATPVLTDAERAAIAAAKADGRVPFMLISTDETSRYGTGTTEDGQSLFVHVTEFAHLRVETDSDGPTLVVAPARRTTIPPVGTVCIAGAVAEPLEGKKHPRAVKFVTLANYMSATTYLADAQKNWEAEMARRKADRKAKSKARAKAAAKIAAEEVIKARRAEIARELAETRLAGVNGDGIAVVALQVVHVNLDKGFAIALDAGGKKYFLAGNEQGSIVLDSASGKIKNLYVPAAGATLPVKGEVVYAPKEGIRTTDRGPYPMAEGWMKRGPCLKQIERLTPAAKKAAETLATRATNIAVAEKARRADIAAHVRPPKGERKQKKGQNGKKSR